MKSLIALIAAFATLAASTEVLLEVSFDISPKEQTDTGFKPTDALQLYLQSTKLKWLRSFHVLVSGNQNKPHRVAVMAFRDTQNWAEFEEEHLVKTHALFDHFWLNSRRNLWHELELEAKYPQRERSVDKPGGFTWVWKYSILPGKEGEWNKYWNEKIGGIVAELQDNEGFVEAHLYGSKNLQKEWQYMLTWEFLGMNSLSQALFDGEVMTQVMEALPHYLSDWQTTILAPPADENGKQIGFFYPAAGADKESEEL